jgi:hypothetical protein
MSDDVTFRKASGLFRSVCKWLTLTFIFVLLVACQSNAPPTTPGSKVTVAATQAAVVDTPSTSTSVPLAVDWDDRAPFQAGLILDERAALDRLAEASIYHIDLQIADDLVHLEGRQAVRYTNQEAEPLNEVYFHLFPNLFGGATEVQAVQVNGGDVAPAYEWGNSAMRVPLSPALQPGQQAVIQMTFSVQVPTEGGGNYGIFAFIDDVLALAHFYPTISVYDDEGWNLEIPPKMGDVVYADSSFFVVQVTAPADLTVVASGVEIARQARDDQQRVTFAGGPMRDFYLVASRRYTAVSERVGETTVNSYALPEFADEAEIVLGHAVDALKVFGARFGVYPFTEFDVVSTPTQALGVEYPGIVAVALRLYDLETGEYPPVYLESTVAHEVGHQWFYSVVGNDQLDEPWLDEALTQYATLLYWHDLYGTPGADGFRSSLYERWRRVEEAQIPIGLPVRAYSGQEYGAVVYGRGPLFFEALAEEMGQETFDAFLRDYYATHKWGIATTDSLKQLAESHCRCDLTQLFAGWVYEP